jgi:signal peptidase I
MNFTEWFLFFLFIQLVHFAGTWKLYQRAGRKAWEAAIPVYNAIVLAGIIKRPKWWVILLFLPVVNQLMFPVFWIETARSFGFNSRKDTILVIITLGLYIYYINYATDAPYKADRSLKPRSAFGEWVSAIAFAIIAATLVHTYVMQPYVIPSSSLEKTLLIGDYLFVSKFHYGARVPVTPISFPMVHDTIPLVKKKSYLFDDRLENKETSWKNKLQLPYMRMPGFQEIQRNDIVVFNQPPDTLQNMNQWTDGDPRTPARNYYKPIDKKLNLVKRCVAVAGDSLEIRDGYIYINGERTVLPERAKPQYNFIVVTNGQKLNDRTLSKYGVREGGELRNGNYLLTLTDKEAEELRKNSKVTSVTKNLLPKGVTDPDVFPHVPSLGWNTDNFGPIYIPKKGATVQLDEYSIPFYKRIISEYEGNQLDIIGNNYFINGEKADSYTFQEDYYWMMGDNRQNSLDARRWGYVPFSHVVGKPVFIWFSKDNQTGKVRWDRVFTTVSGKGERVSYLLYFFIALGLYGLYSFVLKKRFKKSKEE